jgi:hypothetical protein
MKLWILFFTIITTIAGLLMVYFDYDRTLRLKFTEITDMIEDYKKKPKSKRRVVAVLDCDDVNFLCTKTIKSMLDQSMRLDDFAIQTSTPEKIENKLLQVVSVHNPGTDVVREKERDTVIIRLVNGREYPYDFVESVVESSQ